MASLRAVPLSVLLLAPSLAFCHKLAPPPPPPPPPPPSASASGVAPPDATSLVPRKLLLGDPQRSDVQISPDGKSIGWLGRGDGVDGPLNVMVAPADDVTKVRAVTHQPRSIRWWRWTFQGDRILFAQDKAPDKGGDESQHLYAVDLAKSETKDLTPFDGANAELVHLSGKRPREALVAINNRDRKFPDAYVVDLVTGARKLAAQNDAGYSHYVGDDDLRVRFGLRHADDGGVELVVPARGKEPAKTLLRVPVEDALTTRAIDFDKTGDTLYLEESAGRDTSALFALDTKSGTATVVAQDAHADLGHVLMHPLNKTIEAASFEYQTQAWTVIDASVEGDFFYLQGFGDGRLVVTSRSLDEQHWVVGYSYTDGPTVYYRYDRDPDVPGTPGKAKFLFRSSDELERAKLSAMKPVVIKSRDGMDLISYLTIPYDTDPRGEGRPKAPLPTVLVVHDGPWSRASGDTSAVHQWLANRGYAVLSVNFRGSRGLGKALLNAGNLEWGGKMQEDLAAAATWAVDAKIADKDHIAVMGEGYGGYAALLGLATSPFACGVDVGGPSNLLMYLLSAPPYTEPQAGGLAARVGDFRTDPGKKLLEERSVPAHAQHIARPVLIEQGTHDPRVAEAETGQLATFLRSRRVPVTYVAYPDEGRGLARLPNRLSFAAVTESFLAKCLGGAHEPIGGDFSDSSITVPVGPEHVPGVRGALRADQVEPLATTGTADGGATEGGVEGVADAGVDARADAPSKPEADAGRHQDGGK